MLLDISLHFGVSELLSKMDSCCNKIIEAIRSIDVNGDDGIKLNQKFKYIQSVFQKECTSAKHLR